MHSQPAVVPPPGTQYPIKAFFICGSKRYLGGGINGSGAAFVLVVCGLGAAFVGLGVAAFVVGVVVVVVVVVVVGVAVGGVVLDVPGALVPAGAVVPAGVVPGGALATLVVVTVFVDPQPAMTTASAARNGMVKWDGLGIVRA